MSKLDISGIEFIIVSIAMSIMLYKFELSKRIIDEEYEYIKKRQCNIFCVNCSQTIEKRTNLLYD